MGARPDLARLDEGRDRGTGRATDADGDPLAYSASGLPQGAAFDPAQATFRWTPTVAQVGAYKITWGASDGTLADSLTTMIRVTAPPTGGGASGSAAGHAMATAQLVAKGSYPGRYCVSQDWYKVQLAAGATVTFTIGFTNANGDLDLYLYDARGHLLDASATINDYETLTFTAPAGGSHFFKAIGYRGAKNRYDVTVQ